MAQGIMIVGESGTGKSTSVEHLDPNSTFIINVQGKFLPFKNTYKRTDDPSKGNMFVTDKTKVVIDLLKFISSNRKDIKQVVIDDWQYLSANEYMRRANENGFQKFTDIGRNIWLTVELLRDLRDDLKVIFLAHAEQVTDDKGRIYRKVKTVGKLVDNAITVEGMFTIVLFTDVTKTDKGLDYSFATNNEGDTTAKSPRGMFDEKIPNDLNLVVQKVDEFFN